MLCAEKSCLEGSLIICCLRGCARLCRRSDAPPPLARRAGPSSCQNEALFGAWGGRKMGAGRGGWERGMEEWSGGRGECVGNVGHAAVSLSHFAPPPSSPPSTLFLAVPPLAPVKTKPFRDSCSARERGSRTKAMRTKNQKNRGLVEASTARGGRSGRQVVPVAWWSAPRPSFPGPHASAAPALRRPGRAGREAPPRSAYADGS